MTTILGSTTTGCTRSIAASARVLNDYPDAVTIGEIWVFDNGDFAKYLRPDELHLGFNFRLVRAKFDAAGVREAIENSLAAAELADSPPTWCLSNHDVEREVSRYGGGAVGLARAKAMALVMLALPGAVFVYNGEELGLPNVDLPDEVLQDPTWERSGHQERGRDGCRVPMPWSGETPAVRILRHRGHLAADAAGLVGVDGREAGRRTRFDAVAVSPGHRIAPWPRRISATVSTGSTRRRVRWRSACADGMVCVLNAGTGPVPLPDGEVLLTSDAVADGAAAAQRRGLDPLAQHHGGVAAAAVDACRTGRRCAARPAAPAPAPPRRPPPTPARIHRPCLSIAAGIPLRSRRIHIAWECRLRYRRNGRRRPPAPATTLAGRASCCAPWPMRPHVARGREPPGRARRRGGRTRCPVAAHRATRSPSRIRDPRNPSGPSAGSARASASAPAERSAGRTRPPTTRLASTSNPVASQATTCPPGRSLNRITLESSRRNAASTKALRSSRCTASSSHRPRSWPLELTAGSAADTPGGAGPTAPASAPRCRMPPIDSRR